jgi:hypothetical protein
MVDHLLRSSPENIFFSRARGEASFAWIEYGNVKSLPLSRDSARVAWPASPPSKVICDAYHNDEFGNSHSGMVMAQARRRFYAVSMS